jgi:flagellar hook-basal body complex protein FliE
MIGHFNPMKEMRMRDLMIQNRVGPLIDAFDNRSKTAPPKEGSFGKIVTRVIDDVNKQMTDAGKSVEALTTGVNKDIHGTMISMEKASISFQLLAQVRNKIIDAYKEVQRMSF